MSKNKEKRKRGRPKLYSNEIAAEILERLEQGESLNAICKDDHMPAECTVRKWSLDENTWFATNYARARQIGYMRLADELLEISDDGTNDYTTNKDGEDVVNHDHIARSKLRVDTRKWLLSKMLPKVFGDKITQEVTGKDGAALIPVLNVTVGGNAKS